MTLCQCGCGQHTRIAKRTDARKNILKGQSRRYLYGHAPHQGAHRIPRTEVLADVLSDTDRERFVRRKAAVAVIHARNEEAARLAMTAYQIEKERCAPRLKARDAAVLRQVRKAVEAADARSAELRNGGRPKKRSLPPLALKRGPDVLLNALSEYRG